MTEIDRINFLWLTIAMISPVNYTHENYYYDGRRNEFFYTLNLGNKFHRTRILNIMGSRFPEDVECDLAVRLEINDDEFTEIFEIPRLTVSDKIEIQLLFLLGSLSELPNRRHHLDLVRAIEAQNHNYGFVLDTVLSDQFYSAELASSWRNYKLKAILIHIRKFSTKRGIELDI